MRKYPEIATALGYTEALSFPSPLHDLWSPLQQQEPQQEFPTDVKNPASAQQFAEQITRSQPEPPASGVPRMISLEGEIL